MFELPSRTRVGRVVPKNAFDNHTNTRHKQQFTQYVKRITWLNKLSKTTINLVGESVQEIQLFKIELKEESEISKLLEIINKAIPYHIICWVEFGNQAFISTASKHPHPTNENLSVIDWTYSSDWFNVDNCPFHLKLEDSLDQVFLNLCIQINGNYKLGAMSMEEIEKYVIEEGALKKQIKKLEVKVKKEKQFNKKLAFNLELQQLQTRLEELQN